jgi:hypothetical protein
MTAQTILPANSVVDTGIVTNSCRFNAADEAAMSKSSLSGGSTTKGTVSVWLKRSTIGTDQRYWANYGGSASDRLQFGWQAADKLYIQHGDSVQFITTRVFRDVSAWYHVVVAIDSTEADNANRVKVYVNGVRETAFDTFNTLTEDGEIFMNNDKIIVGERHTSDLFYDGYLCEVVQLDGTAAAPTSFGEFDSDTPTVWKPIDVSGLTFGTNGFYLDFEDSSNLGNDKSGGTDLTESNLAATDQSTDTCVNNFATMNPLHFGTTIATGYSNLTEGNCLFTSTQDGSPYPYYFSTMAVSKGKWYAEFKRVSSTAMIGIATGVADSFLGNNAKDYAMYENGQTFTSGSGSGYGDALDNNDIIGVAMDLDNNKLYFSNQGVWQNSSDPESGATGTGALSITAPASNGTGVYHFAVGDSGGGSPVIQCNFGNPIVALSSGNADANDHGNFEYEVPSGYFALCTKNLAEYGG